jgi:gamma-glutamyltranspeptidase / glutathione hydrolase
VVLALLLLPFHGCAPAPIPAEKIPDPPSEPTTDHYAPCHNGVVVSVSGPASDVGVMILKQGGNAVDAAVATAFALEVAYPLAGNIGGGGFMLVHPAPGQGDPVVFDYREAAPAAARPDMYTKEDSQYDHKAVAVPGTLRGLAMAHRRFGRLPWKQLLQPAIALARDGFIVDSALAKTANETLADSLQIAEFQRVFAKPDGTPWQAGDRMIQPDLARTLQTLSDLGPDAFYTGPIAREIVAEMQRGHGLITADDLKNYRAIERKPLTTRYRGKYDVYVPPPPSSGGVCLLEELNILENFDLKNWDRWSPKTFHMMAEAMRRANLDRARYLGDPAFVQTPPYLITRPYAQKLAATIDPDKATRSEDLAGAIPLTAEGPSTTHLSVIDKDGMAVANTYTLERRWGSRIVVKNMGFLLNNEMRAFNLFPGVTDKKGTVGTPPNLIAPGKRPLSSMTPTIVAQGGRVVLVTGSPGSRAIPHTILCILVNVFDFGMSPQAAVASPRFSQDWFPDEISFERMDLYPDIVDGLSDLGHTIVPPGPLPFQGDAHTIWVRSPNHYVGIADDRISGKASGY